MNNEDTLLEEALETEYSLVDSEYEEIDEETIDEAIEELTGDVESLIEDMASSFDKLSLEKHLLNVDYSYLNSSDFKASSFAHRFIAVSKLINRGSGTPFNKTPPVHLQMLDKLENGARFIANLCHRGIGKTTLYGEDLIFYVAIFGELPKIKNITGIIYVGDSMENGVKALRRGLEQRYNDSPFLKEFIPKVKWTDSYIEFQNIDGRKTAVRLMGAKTGIRGIRILGRRPQLAILDDLVSDEDARSAVALSSIRNTIYNCVIPALDPNMGASGVIANGTPFNKFDPVVSMVESGEWDANVYPVCERFPCTRAEFKGSWEDRFTYDYVLEKYKLLRESGELSAFYQEYMLQITSDEERLVHENEIKWYDRFKILNNRDAYNFYVTTDFATSMKHTADFSVVSVWAIDKDGVWHWVDGLCKKTTLDIVVDELFRLVEEYQPLGVGLEASGQQGGIISMIQRMMMDRGVWFNILKDGASMGIRPKGDKLARFNTVLPLFKLNKIRFPKELEYSAEMIEFLDEIRLATASGLKGRDDFLDTISMLNYIDPAIPSDYGNMDQDNTAFDVFGNSYKTPKSSGIDTYLI